MNDDLVSLKKRIGSRVKAGRNAAGMTQEQLADSVARSIEALSNIERGESLPPLDTLQSIADTLSLSLIDLIDDGQRHQSAKREEIEAQLISLLRSLNDDQAELALRLVKSIKP